MAYAYYRTLTVTSNSALLASTQTNFPVLVYISDATLKTVANSGHINNSGNSASGPTITMPYDLIFTSDAAGTTKIPWEVETYDGTNGVLWAWVKIASCALSTVIYVFYGDAVVNSAQNTGSFTPANVWDSSFVGVWHLANGTTLNAVDSTSNGNNGSLTNTPTAGTGQVDGCGSFVAASTQSISFGTGASLDTTAYTGTAWVNATSFPNAYNVVISKNVGAGGAANQLFVKSNGKLACYVRANSLRNYDGTGATTLSSATWYHLTMVYDSTVGLIGYVNAASDNTAAADGAIGTNSAATAISIDTFNAGRNFNGKLDEVRISNTARSADWVKAEYNSGLNPNTFLAIGAETLIGGPPMLMTMGCGA